jgi:hypothetical protein
MPDGSVSIPRAFAGQTVLITGANGYLGSLLLEQLLRTVPDVRRVYVLVSERRRQGQHRWRPWLQQQPAVHPCPALPPQVRNSGVHSAQARVDKMTAGGLFRLVSDEALAKIKVRARPAPPPRPPSRRHLPSSRPGLTLPAPPRWCPAT